jgi:DNA invertase Pin-like site-specific DNA recombinase
MKIGYARVSTDGQELGRQIDALQKAGCEEIFTDTISGTKRSRPELDKMMERLKPGDIVVIQKLDRLGRSMIHLLELLDTFTRKQVQFISLSESFDTTTPAGNLMFGMLGLVAQFERDLISERTKNALKYKKSIGVRLGSPGKLSDVDRKQIVADYFIGMKKVDSIASQHGVSRRTVYNIVKSEQANV